MVGKGGTKKAVKFTTSICIHCQNDSVDWWFQIFFIFTPYPWGFMIQFDGCIFFRWCVKNHQLVSVDWCWWCLCCLETRVVVSSGGPTIVVQVAHFWHLGSRVQSHRTCRKNSRLSFKLLGFHQWWYPTTIGFPTKHDHFGVFWGYHHLRKHPYYIEFFWKMSSFLFTPLKISSFFFTKWRRVSI